MKIWPTRRRASLAATHLAAGLAGIAVASLLLQTSRLGAGFPLAALGAQLASTNDSAPCRADLAQWARDLIANRAALGEDDFAVEAAVTLTLLRRQGAVGLAESDDMILLEATARCSSVLHVPCDGARFETAIAQRCSSQKPRFGKRDAGAQRKDVNSQDATPD